MLNIDVEYIKGILFVRLDGSLNNQTSCILEDVINKIIYKAGIKYLLINLEKLYYIDDKGITTIINTCKNLNNGKLIVCGYQQNSMIKINNSKLFDYALSTNNEISALKLIHI